MSIRIMSHVWEHSAQSSGTLLVLLAIADFADDTGRAFPSVATLARKSRLSERQVQRVIAALVSAGELRVRTGEGPHGTHLFQVVVPTPRQSVTPDMLSPVPPVTQTGDTGAQGGAAGDAEGVTPAAPKPSYEPPLEPSMEPPLPVPPPGRPRWPHGYAPCATCSQLVQPDGYGHRRRCADLGAPPSDPRFRMATTRGGDAGHSPAGAPLGTVRPGARAVA